MEHLLSIQSPWFTYLVLPLFIFLARVLDVTLGTIRIVAVARGMRHLAPLLGFFEIFVWIQAIGQIMKHLDNLATYIAYAAGFAMGNYVGLLIEHRLSLGILLIRVITVKRAEPLIEYLKESGYGATSLDARGEFGPVHLLFTVVKRKELQNVIRIIKSYNPGAFYTIEDVRYVKEEESHLMYKLYKRKRFPFDYLSIRKGK